jgi:6-phosphogluconolactonase
MTARRISILTSLALGSTAVAGERSLVYFGTVTGGKTGSAGIYVAPFDSATGALGAPELAAEAGNPGFLVIHPSRQFLYAIGDRAMPGTKEGGVTAFRVALPGGKLTRLNQVSSMGNNPCHIAMDRTGRMAMVANYGGGSVASYMIKPDGSLSDAVSFHPHTGSSVNPQRQSKPFVHSVNGSPDNRLAFVCDLGTDKVAIYRIVPEAGTMEPLGFARVPAGGGPRHLAFHPNGRFVFVCNEMAMTVTAFSYDADKGMLTPGATVPTLPAADRQQAGLSTAEIAVHPNGRFIYVSNRGHDTIAVFSCEAETGRLILIQNARCEGRTPRHFRLDPTGRWCLIAHQDSNSVAVFAVDAVTGLLKFTGQTIAVPAPICVQFLALE